MMNRVLTSGKGKGILAVPNRTGVTVAYCQHADDKNGYFVSCHQSTFFVGVGTYWQGDVQYPRGLAAVRAGERHLAFFVPTTPNRTRCPMSNVHFSSTAEQSVSSPSSVMSQACALVEINDRAMLLPVLPAGIDDTFLFHGVHVQAIPLEELRGMAHVLFGSLLLGDRPDTPQSIAAIMRIIAALCGTLDRVLEVLGEETACGGDDDAPTPGEHREE